MNRLNLKILFVFLIMFNKYYEKVNVWNNRKLQEKETSKFCFIFLHGKESNYDKNFYDAAEEVCNELGVDADIKVNIEEGEECYNTAKELAENGCKGIFGDSFGHEEYLIKAAEEFPDVQFGHATGTQAHTKKLPNYHNAFASIHEGRYTTGIAAGMKLNEMIENGEIKETEAKVGYIAAFPYAEVISGYTAFYLGVLSVCESATMTVRYTNSWYDEEKEKNIAETLIDKDNCKIISQHADSQGAPLACENKGVPNVFFNGENTNLANSYLISSRINWRPFFRYFIKSTLNGETMNYDYVGNLTNGDVEVYEASSIAAKGTQDAINSAIEKLKSGAIKVFDTSKFTVSKEKNNLVVDDNKHLTSYKADVDYDEAYTGDTEVVSDGYFHETEYRSAPYFDIIIDGIEEILDNSETTTDTTGLNGAAIAGIIGSVAAISAIVGVFYLCLIK